MNIHKMHYSYQLLNVVTSIVIYLPIWVKGQSYGKDDYLTTEQWKKKSIEDAGCPFVEIEQMLVQEVCVMPNYQTTKFVDSNKYVMSDLQKVTVLHIDEEKNQLSLHIKQKYIWCDSRILVNFTNADSRSMIKLSPKNIEKIWYPDLDIRTKNMLEWVSIFDPNAFKEIGVSDKKDGNINCENSSTIIAFKEWKATIYCEFDFGRFPFDTHTCSFIQTMARSSDAKLKLEYEKDTLKLDAAALGYQTKINLIGLADHNSTRDSTAIGFNITLKRILSPYIYQYYLPSLACVFTTQISFMIPLESIPGRVSLIVTVLLALINILIDLFSNNPSGASINALGIYLLAALLFELLVLIELGIVLRIRQRKIRSGKIENQEESIVGDETSHEDSIKDSKLYDLFSGIVRSSKNLNNPISSFTLTEKIDLGSFTIIIVSFSIFNICYWSKFLS